MKYLIITGNPKQDGLCHAVTEEVQKRAETGGAVVDILSVTKGDQCDHLTKYCKYPIIK